MENMKRTVTCGELNKSFAGKEVILNGWVHRIREHGGINFIDLRDRYGLTQVVFDDDSSDQLKKIVKDLKFEYCIAVKGLVRERPESMVNKDISTGEIEVKALDVLILSSCEVLPFMIDEKSDAGENLRLKHRYLDLRSFSMQKKIKLRTDVAFSVRKFLTEKGFMELETPTLIKSTPEGARDFLVPSRLNPGKFYALPQSPQLFKQILMVSGFDKYFQIAHCFRDEDARGDRQLEHTQIDIEMSFVSRDDIFALVENMMKTVFKETLGTDIETPFKRIPYDTAMNLYGSDKPDLRFGMEMLDFNDIAGKSDFQVFKNVIGDGGTVKALVAKGCSSYSRKMITELEDAAKTYGAKGLAWMKYANGVFEGGVSKFFENLKDEIVSYLNLEDGDLLLLMADKWKTACTSLGAVRSKLGKDLNLINPDEFKFCWIVDFPLFEWNEDEKKWDPAHHMFSMPQEQYLETLESDPGSVKGDLYDMVCNGLELASGSIRIHDPKLQKRIFNIVGFSEDEAQKRFGFLLDAFKYGAPPHGGIAPGLDRLLMIMTKETTIKEVIPFPKNTSGISPMDDSPSPVDEKQLKDLFIKLDLE